jgi:hypothetical protein
MQKNFACSFFGVEKNEEIYAFLLRRSVLVIWNQEAPLDSWTDFSLVRYGLVKLVLLNGGVLNLAVHILYRDPYRRQPFLCHTNPSLRHHQSSMPHFSQVQAIAHGLKANGRFRCLIERLFVDVCSGFSP